MNIWRLFDSKILQSKSVSNYTMSQKCHYFVSLYESILIIFVTSVTEKVGNQNIHYFSPHLTNASVLPGETGNPEIECFHSNRELTFTFARPICYRPSVCRLSVVFLSSVCLSSVTLVRSDQAVEIFGNISTAFATLAIYSHPQKKLRRSPQGNPSAGGVKHKMCSQI